MKYPKQRKLRMTTAGRTDPKQRWLTMLFDGEKLSVEERVPGSFGELCQFPDRWDVSVQMVSCLDQRNDAFPKRSRWVPQLS